MSLSSLSQLPMKVCQTCGVEGYSDLLIYCHKCQIIAIHRYCVDGPSNVDEDEVIWSCEECVPRKVKPSSGGRKSERILSKVDREAHRRKARKIWRKNLSSSKVENSRLVEQRENKVAGGASTWDEKLSDIAKRKQRKSKKHGIDSKKVDSELDSPLTKKKKVLNSNDDKRKSSEASLFEEQITEDLEVCSDDGEDVQPTLETNLGPQLSENPDHNQENSSKTDEISDGDSGGETHLNRLEEQQGTDKLSDSVKHTTSDNSKHSQDASASSQRGDKQSGFNVYEIQTSKKKRRLVIAMEYSDSDEEPIYVKVQKPENVIDAGGSLFHMSSGGPPLKSYDNCPNQRLSTKLESVGISTQPYPVTSDCLIPTQSSSSNFENCVIPQLSPVMVNNCYIPAQPIINAVWRGQCSISRNVRPMSFALEACLSSKAHEKVHGAASALPDLLSFEALQKQDAWPESYKVTPPTGEAIGLYFFPIDESDEKWYNYLLDEMIDRDLLLKCCINNLELLAFCSQVLPQGERRFRSKYYLWGAFKRRQGGSMTIGKTGTGISDTMHYKNDFGRSGSSLSCVSPSSVGNCSAVNSSQSHVPRYAQNHFVEMPPSISLKHPKPVSNEQGYVSQMETNDKYSLARSNDNPNSRKTCYPQAPGHGSREFKSSSYHEKRPNLYKNSYGIGRGMPMNNRKESSNRKPSH